MLLGILDGCQNCSKVAIGTVRAINEATGEVEEELKLCAYCTEGVEAPDGYRVER